MIGKFLENSLLNNSVKTWRGKGEAYNKEFSLGYIVNLLNSYCSNGVVYYPSSGTDVNDVHYVNTKKIPEIMIDMPNIFIHTDAMDNYSHFYKGLFHPPVYSWMEGYEWNDDGNKRIIINRYKRNGLDIDFWFIYFNCFCNEVILKAFLSTGMNVDIVFCPVDGITSGMGAFEDCENVPTLLYPLISKQLGIKYIITDQPSKSIDTQSSKKISEWINNLNKLHNDINVSKADVDNIVSETKEIIRSENSFKLFTHYNSEIIIKKFT